jgi:hypothetical protein
LLFVLCPPHQITIKHHANYITLRKNSEQLEYFYRDY